MGIQFAEKLYIIFEWTQPMEWERYQESVIKLIENYELLIEIAFDMFDCNNDGKISEIDI